MLDFEVININNYIYKQNSEGVWIYKASNQIPFKKNGALRKEYKDMPRFSVIKEYEYQEQKDFNTLLEQSVKEISHKLLSFSNTINHI
jgi:hypothetical protein